MIICSDNDLVAPVTHPVVFGDARDGTARSEAVAPWGAELLVLQHPGLASVRFSCRCEGCHHQILTARFGAALADAWFSVRGSLVDPADVIA